MRNVKGKEIYNSKESKQRFYDTAYDNDSIPTAEEFLNHRVIGKDDYFDDVVLPFCLENNVQSVLDVGADHGRYSAKFYNAGIKKILAIEITPVRFNHLNTSLEQHGYFDISTGCFDIEDGLTFNYDLIFLSDIVEHLEDYYTVWNDCLNNSKYVYALIPKEDSWNFSPDHVTRFDDNKIEELIEASKGIIYYDVVPYDKDNSWYALLVKGDL
jgi:2-polyprenyl-3-methyl-5-hydroxy-6-metoxy-1,4-benzoquinol methylase